MQLTHVFSETRQGLRRNVTMHLAMVLTLFVSLTLVGLGVLLNQQADRTRDTYGDLNQITVFLCNKKQDDSSCAGAVTEAQKARVIETLEANKFVDGYHEESQEEAFEKTKKLFQDDINASLPPSFGPDDMQKSIWVDLKGDAKVDDKAVESVITSVDKLPGVKTVRDTRKLVRPIFKTLDALKWGSVFIAAFLVVAALLLVANTVRLAAFARRREIAIMRLVGASTLYVMLPFLLEGLVAAVIGIGLGVGALALFLEFGINRGVSDQVRWMPWVEWPDFLLAAEIMGVLGLVLTLFPTLLLTRKYLKV